MPSDTPTQPLSVLFQVIAPASGTGQWPLQFVVSPRGFLQVRGFLMLFGLAEYLLVAYLHGIFAKKVS